MKRVVNSKNLRGIIRYLTSVKEVEGILLSKSSLGENVLTIICYTWPDNFILSNMDVLINDSKSYDANKPTYYNDKLMYSEIVFDRDSRLSSIKNDKLSSVKKLTI